MDLDSDSDSSSEEEFEREMAKFTHDTGDVTADKWNNPKLLIAKYNQLGLEKLEEEMITSGLETEKAKSTAMLAQIMALQIEIVRAHFLIWEQFELTRCRSKRRKKNKSAIKKQRCSSCVSCRT